MPVRVHIDPGSHTLDPFPEAERMLSELYEAIGCDGDAEVKNNKHIPPIRAHLHVTGTKDNGVRVKLRGKAQLSRHYSMLRMNGFSTLEMYRRITLVAGAMNTLWYERFDQKRTRRKGWKMDDAHPDELPPPGTLDESTSGEKAPTTGEVAKLTRRVRSAQGRSASRNPAQQVKMLATFYSLYREGKMLASAAALFMASELSDEGRTARGIGAILGRMVAEGLFTSEPYSSHDKIVSISASGFALMRAQDIAEAASPAAPPDLFAMLRALQVLARPALAKQAALSPLIAEEKDLQGALVAIREKLEEVRQKIILLEQTEIPEHVAEAAAKYLELQKVLVP